MKTPMELLQFYQSSKWKRVRAFVRHRDNGICRRCKQIGGEVHHKIPLTLDNYQSELAIDPNNLELLCARCHMAERSQEKVREDVRFDEQGRLLQREDHKVKGANNDNEQATRSAE